VAGLQVAKGEEPMPKPSVSRRTILSAGLGAGAVLTLVRPALGQGADLPATPACGAESSPTRRQTEGPYFTPRSPEKRDLRPDGPGDSVALIGFVLTRQCRPVPRALVDLWHADSAGAYDNAGYRFRGHQFTDDQGRFRFLTVVPGLYPGRTRHFHVKVQAPNGPVLTTQLYFPDEPGNARDGIYDRALVMDIRRGDGGRIGRFDFVLAA
jgi:protocatechuate 3,4-dioxygenase beta subunit